MRRFFSALALTGLLVAGGTGVATAADGGPVDGAATASAAAPTTGTLTLTWPDTPGPTHPGWFPRPCISCWPVAPARLSE